jgi:hypothetical protein
VLEGTTQRGTNQGIATFTGLAVRIAGEITIVAYVSADPSINTTRTFIVSAGKPAALPILRQPQDTTLTSSNLGIIAPVRTAAIDAYQNLVAIQLRATLLSANLACGGANTACPRGLIEGGSTESTNLRLGYAEFDRLQILIAGNNYRLSIAGVDGEVTNVTDAFSIFTGDAKTITMLPSSACPPLPDVCGVVGQILFKQPRVVVADILGNPLTSGYVYVHLYIYIYIYIYIICISYIYIYMYV